jgi:talin
MIIHAVRDVAASLANLIQATKHASGRSPNDPAIAGLKESAKLMVTSVSSLLRTIKAAENAGQRGMQALETAVGAIDAAVQKYDSGSSELAPKHYGTAPPSSSPEEVLRAARAVTDATAKATSAASSMQQEAVIASANLARQAVAELLHCTRTAALSAESPDLKYRMLNCGRDVALQVKHLLATLQTLLAKPNDNSTKATLLQAAKEIANVGGSKTVNVLANVELV